jgi:hypothetical protein
LLLKINIIQSVREDGSEGKEKDGIELALLSTLCEWAYVLHM